jgi:hypothetical protein
MSTAAAPLHPAVAELARARAAYSAALSETETLAIEADRWFARSLDAGSKAEADAMLKAWREVKLRLGGTNADRREAAKRRLDLAEATVAPLPASTLEWWRAAAGNC